jgi:hypothetical protein
VSDEVYAMVEDYQQTGKAHPSGAIGDLANENLFSGIKATSFVVGYSLAFW